MNMRSPITRRVLAPAVVTGLLLVGGTACGSSSDKKASDTVSSDQTTDDTTAGSTTAGTDSSSADTGGAAAEVPDPCKGITESDVSTAVGFTVEGDGKATDNGDGFLSCSYSAPLSDPDHAGATVTIGTEQATRTTDDIKDTLAAMTSDAKPTEVHIADGGWVIASGGMTELRVLVGKVQLTVNVLSPSDAAADPVKASEDLATLVISRFGKERPPTPSTTTTTVAVIAPGTDQ